VSEVAAETTGAPAPAPAEPLRVTDLAIEARGKAGTTPIVRGVSLELAPGEILGLIGESGSGKTMTCRAIVGALPGAAHIVRGSVEVGGRVVRAPNVSRRTVGSAGVGMIFADPHASLDPLQRIGAQINEMLRVHRGLHRRAARREALALLERVSLPDPERVYRQFPFQVSGGMAQRAMIASVLAMRPRFLLADEPTSALDATIQLEILDLLLELKRAEGVGVILTTHDIGAAARICDRIGVMYAGRVVETGPAADVLTRPRHPYTTLLLEARPRGTKLKRLAAIPGEPVSPAAVGAGCAFAPRCPRAQPLCVEVEPLLDGAEPRGAACHFPVEANQRAAG
jgi:oligopeptide/dipeptide ABC transporter ATP-binding protein